MYDSHSIWCLSNLSPVSINEIIIQLSFDRVKTLHGKLFLLWCGFWSNFYSRKLMSSQDWLQGCGCLNFRLSFQLCLWGFEMSSVPVNSWLEGELISLMELWSPETLWSEVHASLNALFNEYSLLCLSHTVIFFCDPISECLAWQHLLTRPVWKLHFEC